MKTVGMGAYPSKEADLQKENLELRERIEALEKENGKLKAGKKEASAKKKTADNALPQPEGEVTEQ